MTEEKKPSIILVNHNIEKMAAKKNAVLKHNAEVTQYNKKIERAKIVNTVLSIILSILLGSTAGMFFWMQTEVAIFGLTLAYSKIIFAGIALLCAVIIVEGISISYRKELNKRKRSLTSITEAMRATAFFGTKKIDKYVVIKHKNTPYINQKAYVTFYVDDDSKKLKYTSLEKWTLILLPDICDVVVDSENTTLYIPYESDDSSAIKTRIGNQISQELLVLEKEARINAEKELQKVVSEKEAIERVLNKTSGINFELQKKLDETETKLKNANSVRDNEQKRIMSLVETEKKEKTSIATELNKANDVIAQKIKEKEDIMKEKDALKREIENLKKEKSSLEDKLTTVKDEKEQLEKEISEIPTEFSGADLDEQSKRYVSSLKVELAAVKREKENALKLLSAIEKKNAENQESISELSTIGIDLRTKAENYDKVVAEKKKDQEKIRSLEASLKKVTSSCNELKAQNESLSKTISDSKTAITTLLEENKQLKEDDIINKLSQELFEAKEQLTRETAVREQKEKDYEFEHRKAKVLETKIEELKKSNSDAKQSFNAEKQKLISDLEKQKKITENAIAEKEETSASLGVQERALAKEKDKLYDELRELRHQVRLLPYLEEENKKLEEENYNLRNEDVEKMKKEFEEKLACAREDKTKAEKRMREALETAAKEKADRIKSEEALNQYIKEQKQKEEKAKESAHEAEMARAREAAERAKRDAMNAREEKDKENKRSIRNLNF